MKNVIVINLGNIGHLRCVRSILDCPNVCMLSPNSRLWLCELYIQVRAWVTVQSFCVIISSWNVWRYWCDPHIDLWWWPCCVQIKQTVHFMSLKISFFSTTRIVSVELPPGARKFGVQFRWWQPYHSGRGHDVWALDEISMTSVLFNTISLDFSNVLDVTQSLGFYLGHVQPYCQHDWTLR